MLDRGAESLKQHVANKVYEKCRAGDGGLDVANFPDYKPLVSALQANQPEIAPPEYQVTIQRHDKLVILSSLANKFLENEEFKVEAANLIAEHNGVFNKDGDYLAEPKPNRTLQQCIYTLWAITDSDVNDWTSTWWSPNTLIKLLNSLPDSWFMLPNPASPHALPGLLVMTRVVLSRKSNWNRGSWPPRRKWTKWPIRIMTRDFIISLSLLCWSKHVQSWDMKNGLTFQQSAACLGKKWRSTTQLSWWLVRQVHPCTWWPKRKTNSWCTESCFLTKLLVQIVLYHGLGNLWQDQHWFIWIQNEITLHPQPLRQIYIQDVGGVYRGLNIIVS